jgi:hypothetical protein
MNRRKSISRIADSMAAIMAVAVCVFLAGCASLPPLPVNQNAQVHLKISATIDGSDKVTVTAQGAKWEHISWRMPTNVCLNGIKWSLADSLELNNAGKTQFLPQDVDFSSAKVASRHGRDIVAMETYPDKIIVYFGDNPNGAAPYDIDIVFGR